MTESTETTDQHPALDTLNNLKFCVFDLETTGGNHKSDKIIEIGLVRIENYKIVDEKSYLINPELKIPEFIQRLTNIKQEDVSSSPKIEEVIDDILDFMGEDTILVAHNTSFDVPFFNSVLRRLGRPELKHKSICTNLMTKYLIPNLLNSNLNYMCKIFDIKHKKAHRALDDAYATSELLIKYLKIFIDKNIEKLNHLYYPRNRYELDRIHYKSKRDSKEKVIEGISKMNGPSLITIKGENGIIHYALPCQGTQEEKELLISEISECDWRTVTIKIFGPFLEALVHYNGLFSKISPSKRSEILAFLWKHHLPHIRPPHRDKEVLDRPAPIESPGDFVVMNHLVPEQMLIFPLKAMTIKNQLIFRYPSHKKKLLQFINSKINRLENNKLKVGHIQPALKEFMESFILEKSKGSAKEKNNEKKNTFFIFDKNSPLKNSDQFLKDLDAWLSQNPNPYNYPKHYI